MRNGRVMDPRHFFEKDIGVDTDVLDSLSRPNNDPTMEGLILNSENVDNAFRALASQDDEK